MSLLGNMEFFVLVDRDMPERADMCSIEHLKPFELVPSTAKCPSCNALLEPARWASPHRGRPSSTRCGDILLGAGFELVISRRAWTAFQEDAVEGLDYVAPLETAPATEREYVVVRPHVTLTRLDEAASNVVWRRPPTCASCRLGVRESLGPLKIDASTWDRSDVFVASGAYGLKIVTRRFAETVEQHNLEGFFLIASDSYYEDGTP
jgi:hypothetical protein